MKKAFFSISTKKTFLINFFIVVVLTLLILLIIINSSDLKTNIISQSMLLIGSISAVCTAYLMQIKKKKWIVRAFQECCTAIVIYIANSISIFLIFKLFAYLNSPGFSPWKIYAFKFDVFILLAACIPMYLIFRLLFIFWRKINRLKKQYFAWSLTYYFLVAVSITVVFILLLGIVINSILYSNSSNYLEGNLSGKVLDWLVFTLFPVAAIFFSFLFVTLMVLIPPSTVFSLLFARQITRRLKQLSQATAYLREGNYQTRSPIEGEDEIAQLQSDFNMMAENLEQSIKDLEKEKKVVDGLLEERKELVASVSHELRTPITTIMNYIDVIQNNINKKKDSELAANLDVIAEETNRLNLIVSDLFDLSRAELGQLTIKNTPCDIQEIIHKVVETQKPLAWQTGHVDLIFQIEKDLPTIKMDSNRLMQILINLIRNGVQHTPPGGIVQISAKKQGNSIAIFVMDTGEGIAADELPNIWQRFYKGQHTTGAGIGLSVVKELTELMGGSIDVKSEVGVGTEFQLDFPITKSKKRSSKNRRKPANKKV